ncbi:unnamed protein product, partial [Ectocarpus sp. 12 AP-2014]
MRGRWCGGSTSGEQHRLDTGRGLLLDLVLDRTFLQSTRATTRHIGPGRCCQEDGCTRRPRYGIAGINKADLSMRNKVRWTSSARGAAAQRVPIRRHLTKPAARRRSSVISARQRKFDKRIPRARWAAGGREAAERCHSGGGASEAAPSADGTGVQGTPGFFVLWCEVAGWR